MYQSQPIPGEFLRRPNRFIAQVRFAEGEMTVHVKNTGRCRELLTPGARVWCLKSDNPHRKTGYDLIAVEKGDLLINMDAQAPNAAAKAWLEGGGLGPVENLRPETVYGSSRLDFSFTLEGRPCLMEVKGVTLEEEGICAFPDAPTQRGAKHLRELTGAAAQGCRCFVLFVIQMSPVKAFRPNEKTDPQFAQALREAAAAGVEILAYSCRVTPGKMEIFQPVPVFL